MMKAGIGALKTAACCLLLTVAPPGAGAARSEVPAGMRASGPVVCTGDDDIVVRNVYIETDGNGVVVGGNCTVEIINSRIEAGGVGVLVNGNGGAEVSGSEVSGRAGGLIVEGNGDLAYENTTVRGGVAERGNGALDDLGGNSVSGAPERPTARYKRSGDVEEYVSGDLRVRSGPEGLQIETATGSVVMDGDFVRIEGPEGVLEIEDDSWRDRETVYVAGDVGRLLEELGATVVAGELALDLAGDILFGFDSVAIQAAAAAELAKVAHVIRQRSAGEVLVVGHTDSIGEPSYNQKLSERRAVAVMRWLNEKEGVPVALMRGRGMGEEQPVAHNTRPDGSDDPAGRARNRRVEIRFPVGG